MFDQRLLMSAVIAYLLGGIPFGYLFVRMTTKQDIRAVGSGNIGATNVHRTAGRKAGIIVLLLDIAKGFLAVWIGALLTDHSPVGMAIAVFAVMLGHVFPIFLGFKGGKAVATFIGAFLYIAPLALLIVLLLFVAIVWMTKYISLGSIVGAAVFPFVLWLVSRPAAPIVIAAALSAALIIWRHSGNISRLLKGTENVFSFKGGKA